LKNAGYATCHSGKWHLNGYFNDPRHPQPNDHGYDHWFATQNNAAPNHKNPTNFVRNGKEVGRIEGFSAPIVVDEAITWLTEQRDATKPFFMTVWTHEPHLPIESDPKHQEWYKDIEDPDVRQHHGNVTQLDHAFGNLIKTLDELKLTDNTFVVFTSDNGPEGNGNTGRTRGSTGGLRGRKRSVYEGGIRVAGIVRWPGHVPAGGTCDVPVIGSDLFNTVCEITGTPVPTDRVLDGVSFAPTFAGNTPPRPIPFYWRCYIAPEKVQTAMRVGDWKILAAEDLSYFELYNVQADPKEEKELSSAEPERFATMKAQLQKLNGEIEAEGPDWWREYEAKDRAKKRAPKKPAK
jgi:arylsulfatase A